MKEEINVGSKIKELRVKKSMTAKDLANQSGISFGMLSQLEKGSTQGSVETLRKVAKVLDVTLAFLFTSDNEDYLANGNMDVINDEKHYVVRKDERKKISFPDPLYTCELLVPDLQGDIEMLQVNMEPNRVTDEIIPHTKGGEECDYVLEGEIVVTLNTKEFSLQKGDSIRFNPEIPHKIENRSNKKASYLSVITPVSF
ncbi:XRE family transcriptional regulator [Halarcobacter ebronensis]|uniref:XRE family transcriptional regulator n=1 Tax=Halarcobacter ebronensis TaxID=1462615 RepID=A0A4Q0Y840_9BACT|nr:cupin domain-containing protein [Halarcobacter ebronensis]RXJ65624.1 XRE family transcriptional regulator [Halarcobacter ebronensis]